MKRIVKPYRVLLWNINRDEEEWYDVMPYLISMYKKITPKKRPKTFEEIRTFIKNESMYQFWSRCQYEIVVTGFPKRKNEAKIDAYQQIENNLDVITNHFISTVL